MLLFVLAVSNRLWALFNPINTQYQRGERAYLQHADVASLSTDVEAGPPRRVLLVGVGSQPDQVSHHQVLVVPGRQVKGSLGEEPGVN